MENKQDERLQHDFLFLTSPDPEETQGFSFNVQEKKRRPWYKDLAVFCLTVIGTWGITYIGMNVSAFAQIAEFKISELKTSLFTEPEPEVLETVTTRPSPSRMRSSSEVQPKNAARQVFSQMKVIPSDNRVYIPRIKKNIPLVQVPAHQNWKQLETNIQDGLRKGVVVHPVSHEPGTYGNFFLTGHSSYYAWDNGKYKDVFAVLHEVNIDEEVIVYWEGKEYKYKIRESQVVSPTEVSVLNQPKNNSIITLMTCTPVGTNKNRLILVGDLVEEV